MSDSVKKFGDSTVFLCPEHINSSETALWRLKVLYFAFLKKSEEYQTDFDLKVVTLAP